jgi:TonB family protein
MKTMSTVFDHDREYGRDIRLAGVVALVSLTVAFLFVPQPKVEPYRLRGPAVTDFTIVDPGPIVYVPPKPPEPVSRGIPVASNNPTVTTVAPNSGFTEIDTGVAAPAAITWDFIRVERKPVLIHQFTPAYPEMALAAGIEGKVVVSMAVDTLGSVSSVEVYATSGNVLLDQAAVAAAYQCRFTPGYQRDRPVVVRNVILPFNFKLR